MDNIKNDEYYVNKIVEDIDFICEHMNNVSIEEFEKNDLLIDSMQFRLIQISENAGKLTESFQDKHQIIDFFAIKGLRNRLVHDYGNVDYRIIYDTLANDMKNLKRDILK